MPRLAHRDGSSRRIMSGHMSYTGLDRMVLSRTVGVRMYHAPDTT